MGKRGPLPSTNPRRRNKRPEPPAKPSASRPDMPAALSAEAQAEWGRIVPELDALDVLSPLDRSLLVRYCEAWASWVELSATIARTGIIVKGRVQDTFVRSPVWLARQDIETTLASLGRDLALSPTVRLRAGMLHQRPPSETVVDDPKVALMQGYRDRLG